MSCHLPSSHNWQLLLRFPFNLFPFQPDAAAAFSMRTREVQLDIDCLRSQSLAATSAINPAIENPMQVVDGAIGCEPSHASTAYLQDCHKQLAAAYLWQGKMLKH